MMDSKFGRKKCALQTFAGYVVLAVISTISAIVFAIITIILFANYSISKKENATLQNNAISSVYLKYQESVVQDLHSPQELPSYYSAFDEEMRLVNSDYIGWIKIDGTKVNYPVVRGNDNEKYLSMSFTGEKNYLGTLFMDYRCFGERVPNIIIYGHNSRQGDLFGGLRLFLDEQYLLEHPLICLIVNDRFIEYKIFSARMTNVNDPAYKLDFVAPGSFHTFTEKCGAPLGSAQIITLSTCYSGNNDDERVIVQAALNS